MHGPVGPPRRRELSGAVDGVDDPHPVGLQPCQVVGRLLGEDGVVGPVFAQPIEDQRVGPGVTGVAEVVVVVEADLLADRDQEFACLCGYFGG